MGLPQGFVGTQPRFRKLSAPPLQVVGRVLTSIVAVTALALPLAGRRGAVAACVVRGGLGEASCGALLALRLPTHEFPKDFGEVQAANVA